MATDNTELWDRLKRLTERLRDERLLEPMPVAELRRLMEAPAADPDPREQRIALNAVRLLAARARGREAGTLLAQLILTGIER
jgi:hypothetical protein